VARGCGSYHTCSSSEFQDATASRNLHMLHEETGGSTYPGIEHVGTKLNSKPVHDGDARSPKSTMSKLQHRRNEQRVETGRLQRELNLLDDESEAIRKAQYALST
jgi:hypothetical protein